MAEAREAVPTSTSLAITLTEAAVFVPRVSAAYQRQLGREQRRRRRAAREAEAATVRSRSRGTAIAGVSSRAAGRSESRGRSASRARSASSSEDEAEPADEAAAITNDHGPGEPIEHELPPPQFLRGLVRLALAKPTKIRRVAVRFQGVARTEWPEGAQLASFATEA